MTLNTRKLNDLITLVQQRYPDWKNFSHPQFVVDEISHKQKIINTAQSLIAQIEVDKLIAQGNFDEFVARLDKLSKQTNLLWRNVPSQGDTAVLHVPTLDKPTFCTHMRNLLYGDRPTGDRLQSFSDYLNANNLPNKWPFATFFLFICHPDSEIIVKPQPTRWFLKYMGTEKKDTGSTTFQSTPNKSSYTSIKQQSQALLNALKPFAAKDMVDAQSFIWICFRESKARVGRLPPKGQVALDIPPTDPDSATDYVPTDFEMTTNIIAEPQQSWSADAESSVLSINDLASTTGYTKNTLETWLHALERKKQMVFYGPPGTGKTYTAQKLAQYLINGANGRNELVQFHPAYAYEDFVQGIRPFTNKNGILSYQMQPGRFVQFCAAARQIRGPAILIIDEINRANIASVFGELMYLLEYRERAIPLAGGGSFSIPANVRIIGTMNTADRSIALVDHALRRRFAFVQLAPNMDILRHYYRESTFPSEKLITKIEQLNHQIGDPHYLIGHSFFMQSDPTNHLPVIWRFEIEPYLEEFFFDQPDRADEWRWEKIADKIFG